MTKRFKLVFNFKTILFGQSKCLIAKPLGRHARRRISKGIANIPAVANDWVTASNNTLSVGASALKAHATPQRASGKVTAISVVNIAARLVGQKVVHDPRAAASPRESTSARIVRRNASNATKARPAKPNNQGRLRKDPADALGISLHRSIDKRAKSDLSIFNSEKRTLFERSQRIRSLM